MRTALLNSVVSLLSILTALYCAELFLVWRNPLQRRDLAKVLGNFDARSRYQVVQDLRRAGENAYPVITPWLFVSTPDWSEKDIPVFPFSGLSNRYLVYCNEAGYYSGYYSDQLGFNNPEGEEKGAEVVSIGDSFVNGACVRQGDDISSQLRTFLHAKVYNLGQSGNGPLLELAGLREFGAEFHPKVVLWFYFEGNDLDDLIIERRSDQLRQYLSFPNYRNGAFSRQSTIDRELLSVIAREEQKELGREAMSAHSRGSVAKEIISTFFRLSNLRNLWANFRAGSKSDHSEAIAGTKVKFEDIRSDFRRIMLSARDATQSWGGKLYFVYLPDWQRLDHPTGRPDLYHHKAQLLKLVGDLGIPVFDFAGWTELAKVGSSIFPYRGPDHYSKEGYRLLAEFVARGLKEDRALPQAE